MFEDGSDAWLQWSVVLDDVTGLVTGGFIELAASPVRVRQPGLASWWELRVRTQTESSADTQAGSDQPDKHQLTTRSLGPPLAG